MKIVLILALLTTTFQGGLAEQNMEGSGSNSELLNQTVSIGGLFSVHTNEGGRCGKIRDSPFVNVQAMIYAVHMINADSSILPNVTLSFDIRDTCGVSNLALENAVSLMEINGGGSQTAGVGISGVVGAAQSDVSISVASLLRIFQVPQISHSSTAAVLSDKQRFDYFFRTIPPDSFQARAMANLISHFNWSYIIGVHTDDTYGRGGINSLMEELREINNTRICMVTDEATAIPLHASKIDYDQVLSFIKLNWIKNASVVVLFVQYRTAVGLLEAIGDDTSYDHITWIASDAWATRIPMQYHNRIRGMLGVIPMTRYVKSFVNYYESLTLNNHSGNPWFDEYWKNQFNCSLNPDSQRACDEQSQRLTYDNQTAGNGVEYVINAVYAFAHAIENLISDTCTDNIMCDGILVERFSQKALNGTKLREYLYNVSFTSLTTDEVTFDKTGDQQGFYHIVNMRQSGLTKVGTWNSIDLLEITSKIEWRNGSALPESVCSLPCGNGEEPELVLDQSDCCWTCQACSADSMVSTGEKCTECDYMTLGVSPNDDRSACEANPVVYLKWSDPWAVLILIGTTLGLAVTAFVVVIFAVFNKHRIIKAASRELCAILLTGITLCYVLPFLFIAPPSPTTCAIRRFSIGFCFSLCFSPLLMKTNRIYRVFHQAPRTPRFAGPRSQVVFTCLLVSVQALIGAVWLIAERPNVVFIHHPDTTEKICGESLYVSLPIYLLYNLFLLVLSTFYAFLARKIPSKFNETKFIAVTLYSICVIWLGFIPTYFASLVKLGAVHQIGTLMSAVLFSATTTLVCLFIPKVILLFVEMAREKKEVKRRPSGVSISTDFKMSAAEISSATIDFKLSTEDSSMDDLEVPAKVTTTDAESSKEYCTEEI